MQELPDESVERLARVTKLLTTQRTLPAKLEAVVAMVKQAVDGCDSAGVILLVEGEPTTTAVTDRLAVEIDLVQYETGEGPCLSAIEDGHAVRIDVVAMERRFARVAPGALAHDVRSILSVPLVFEEESVGALNLYSHEPDAFGGRALELVQPLADYAAEAIRTSALYAYSLDMVDGLMEGMEARAVIHRAREVLTATEGLSAEAALDRLRHLALASGRSMHDVASWLLEERPTEPQDDPSKARRRRVDRD